MLSRSGSKTLRSKVKGLMIESYLVEGSQKVGENIHGKSITDACLGWDDSERLVRDLAELGLKPRAPCNKPFCKFK